MSLPNMASRRFNVTVIGYRGWTGSMLSAIARKDYDDRRRRQMQGIARQRWRVNIAAGLSLID